MSSLWVLLEESDPKRLEVVNLASGPNWKTVRSLFFATFPAWAINLQYSFILAEQSSSMKLLLLLLFFIT